jgi:hypothetical protein
MQSLAITGEVQVRVLGMLLVGAMLAGCASGRPRGPQRQADVITFAEIEPLRVATAYEVVEQLRPEFFRTRGSASVRDPTPAEAVVYLDGSRMGPPATLRSVSKTTLKEIRYLDANAATVQFGTGHRGGAILVVTR